MKCIFHKETPLNVFLNIISELGIDMHLSMTHDGFFIQLFVREQNDKKEKTLSKMLQ